MYKLDLPLDHKEFAALEARRQREIQRQSRIFNAKVRTIGIDLLALKEQERERKCREQMEKNRDEAFHADMVRNDKINMLLDKRQQDDIRRLNKSLEHYRKTHQPVEGRREFDLYDPDALKKDKPARITDDDPRCTISSIQKFEGEDLNNPARRKLQQEQMREWSKRQANEREALMNKKKEADLLYDRKQIELDNRAMSLEKAQEECRRNVRIANANYNKALAAEVDHQKNLNHQREQDDNATEIANHIHGDFLSENPSVARSSFGPHRVVTDRFKGLAPEAIAEMRNTQKAQIEEKHARELDAKKQDREWDLQRAANSKAAILLEREKAKLEREQRKKLAEDNKRLAEEQSAHKSFLDKSVYTNPPTAAYFMQFNTVTR